MAVASAREFFEGLQANVDAEKTKGVKNSYLFDVAGVGQWKVDVDDGKLSVSEGDADADVRISISEDDFLKINRGEVKPADAFMKGTMKVKGDVGAAMKLDSFL